MWVYTREDNQAQAINLDYAELHTLEAINLEHPWEIKARFPKVGGHNDYKLHAFDTREQANRALADLQSKARTFPRNAEYLVTTEEAAPPRVDLSEASVLEIVLITQEAGVPVRARFEVKARFRDGRDIKVRTHCTYEEAYTSLQEKLHHLEVQSITGLVE